MPDPSTDMGGSTVGPGPGDDGLILERPVLDGDGILRGYEPVAAPHPLACAGLHGGCPDCRELYLLGLRTAAGGREPAVGVCLVCSHKHWPWEAHADHQWDDACPYEGTGCVVGR